MIGTQLGVDQNKVIEARVIKASQGKGNRTLVGL